MTKLLFLIIITLTSHFALSQFQRDNGLEYIAMKGAISTNGDLYTYNYHQIFSSNNNGASWKEIGNFGSSYIEQVSIEDTTIYILMESSTIGFYEIYYSSLNNLSWNSYNCNGIGQLNGSGWGIEQFLIKDGYFFVGNHNGNIFKSYDKGLNWFDSSNGLITDFTSFCQNSSTVNKLLSDANNIYVGTQCYGVYYSDNNGQSWSPLNNGIPMTTKTNAKNITKNSSKFFAKTNKGLFESTDNGLNWALDTVTVHTTYNLEAQDNFVLMDDLSYGFVYSQNNGLSWNNIHNEFMNYASSKTIISDSTGFYLFSQSTSHGGVSKLNTIDSTFTFRSYGLTKNHALHMFHRDSIYLLSTKSGGLYYSFDAGNNWQIEENEMVDIVVNSIIEHDTVFIASTNNGIYHSYDSGINWDATNIELSSMKINSVIDYGSSFFAATNEGVMTKNINNTFWVPNNMGLADSTINYMYLNSDVLHVCTNQGVYFLDTINNYWVNYNVQMSSYKIYSMVKKGDTVVLGSDNQLFMSIDNGNLWIPYNIGGGERVNSILTVNSDIYAGSSNGVFAYTENNPFWNNILPNETVNHLQFSNSYLYASTQHGLYKGDIGQPLEVNKFYTEPLIKIYPNPTSGSLNVTSDELEIDEISIIDITGNVVKTVIFNTTVNVSDLPRGVFFIKLIADNKIITKKFIKN